MYRTLISTDALASELDAQRWVVVDCRFELSDPEAGHRAYLNGHLPSAVYAHLNDDLSSPPSDTSGRHPLPDPKAFARTLGGWGIGKGKQVVAYDAGSGAFAARLWWMLRRLGHEAVAVLDGGFKAWVEEGQALEKDPHVNPPTVFNGKAKFDQTIAVEKIEASLDHHNLLLLDTREPARYAGQIEPIDHKAGHIPGAKNHPFQRNLDARGRFLPPEVLKQQFDATLAGTPANEAVVYCGSGVSACHNLLAMVHAGLSEAQLYVGSWSEWSRDPTRPVETGGN